MTSFQTIQSNGPSIKAQNKTNTWQSFSRSDPFIRNPKRTVQEGQRQGRTRKSSKQQPAHTQRRRGTFDSRRQWPEKVEQLRARTLHLRRPRKPNHASSETTTSIGFDPMAVNSTNADLPVSFFFFCSSNTNFICLLLFFIVCMCFFCGFFLI